MRYICNKHKPELLGTTLEEKAHMDMMEGIVGSLKGAATMPCYIGTPRNEVIQALSPMAKGIDNWCAGKDFVAGKNVTYLDFVLYELSELCDCIFEGKFMS